MVRTGFIGAAFGDGLRSFHHERAAKRALRASGTRFDDEFALRIVRAAEERTEAAAPLDDLASILGAFYARTVQIIAVLALLDVLALRIIGAGNEASEAAFFLDELPGLAFRAGLAGLFRRFEDRAVYFARTQTFREKAAA